MIYWVIGRVVKTITAKTKSKLDDIIVDMVEEPVMLAIILAGFWFASLSLVFPDGVKSFISHGITFAVFLNIACFI